MKEYYGILTQYIIMFLKRKSDKLKIFCTDRWNFFSLEIQICNEIKISHKSRIFHHIFKGNWLVWLTIRRNPENWNWFCFLWETSREKFPPWKSKKNKVIIFIQKDEFRLKYNYRGSWKEIKAKNLKDRVQDDREMGKNKSQRQNIRFHFIWKLLL